MKPDFAPRGVGEILDGTLALLRARWRAVLGAAAILLLPVAVLVGTLQSFYMRGFLALIPVLEAGPDPPQELFDLTALSTVQYAASMALLLVNAFYVSALITALPALLHGRAMRPAELLAGGWRRLVWYVLAGITLYVALGMLSAVGLLVGVLTLGIGLLIAVPLIAWLAARLSLVTTIAVAEQANPFTAFRRSWALTSRRALRVVGFYLAVAVLLQVLMAAVNSPSVVRQVVDVLMNAPAENPFVALMRPVAPGWKLMEGLLYGAAVSLSVPVGTVAWYLFYLDLRSRREGMDLMVRASALEDEA
ncbi:MAG: hypothetical protein IBX62_05825 [Coriobacteriia bacterium]|nr:hypothetical protein [Coriobacteriia bacterium]